MFEPTSADAVRHLDSIDRKSADLCSEIQSLRAEIRNESSRAEFRFYFWVIQFFCILLAVIGAGAKLR
jgi:hypothetical protein